MSNSIERNTGNFDIQTARKIIANYVLAQESKAILWSRDRNVFQWQVDAPCRSFRRIICKYCNLSFCWCCFYHQYDGNSVEKNCRPDSASSSNLSTLDECDFIEKIRRRFLPRPSCRWIPAILHCIQKINVINDYLTFTQTVDLMCNKERCNENKI